MAHELPSVARPWCKANKSTGLEVGAGRTRCKTCTWHRRVKDHGVSTDYQMRRRPVPVWVVRDQSDQSIASIASWTFSWRFVGHGLKIQLFQGKMTRSIGAIGAWNDASDPCHWKEDSGTGAPQLDMGGGSSGDDVWRASSEVRTN